MRFYEVDSGTILLDGVDIADMKREELRALTGMVLQDTWLFGGTIRDNIAYGCEGATARAGHRGGQGDLRGPVRARACRTAMTPCSTRRGDKRQHGGAAADHDRPRVPGQACVLILDEATSSVDTRTEVLVQRAMASLRQGRTSFVIAHRLSTIRDADVILVMEHGRIVEQGTHQSCWRLAARTRGCTRLSLPRLWLKSPDTCAGAPTPAHGSGAVGAPTPAHGIRRSGCGGADAADRIRRSGCGGRMRLFIDLGRSRRVNA